MKKQILLVSLIFFTVNIVAQNSPFQNLEFLLGNWQGTGSGFGNSQSKITTSFQSVMNEQFIEVINDSKFEPTASKPEGEHHIDRGMISFDKARNLIVFRQFHIEGFINQYVLIDSLSTDNFLVFQTEHIENFVPGGSAKWTIEKTGDHEIETKFYLAFPGQDAACYGTNKLTRNE
ncbi:MAG: hypothetical protein AB7U05_08785 [Mangrovibacterium sp.]